MAVGVSVTLRSAQLYYQGGYHGGACAVDPANFKLGLGMYGSYLVLFSLLFWDKYKGKGAAKGKGADKNPNLCGVELTKDGAGFFQPDELEHANNAPARAPSPSNRSSKRD
jgi:hypothetical protein